MEFFLSLCKTLQTDVTRKHTYGTVSVSEQLLVDLQLWPGVGPTQRIRNSHIPVWTSWWSTLETPTQRASPHWSLRTSWARQWTASSDHTSPANTFRESNKVRVLEWLYSVTFGPCVKQSEAHPPSLVALRQHDDDGRFLLQDHLPEVVAGLGQRTLSGDVLFIVFVSLKTQTETFSITQQESHEVRRQQLRLEFLLGRCFLFLVWKKNSHLQLQ